MAVTDRIRRLSARLGDLVVPAICAGCDRSISADCDDLCASCWSELAHVVGGDYCQSCGSEPGPHLLIDRTCNACRTGKAGLRFLSFVRAGRYAGVLRTLILKHKREIVLERLLGRLLTDAIESQMDGKKVDLWIPVPSHWLRSVRRGFQPAALLAERVARGAGSQAARLLTVTRHVPQFHLYAGLSARDRQRAVHGAFRVNAPDTVRGAAVCLVDDVMTTGATLAEAKRTLRRAGARSVSAAVVARTVQHFPSAGASRGSGP